jgi:uncharacterized protein (TIGR03382 family)
MKRPSFSRAALLTTLGFVLALALPVGSASASKQALVKLNYVNLFFSGVSFGAQQGYVPVTVNTTTTPTPSIMWPASLVKCTPGTGCTAESFTYYGYYTPFASRMGTFMNGPAQLSKNHAGAAASPSQVLVPVGSGTTKCFENILSDGGGTTAGANPNNATNGLSAIPNQCFPRVGSGKRFPGTKKFGGTAKMLRRLDVVGTFLGSPSGLSQFDLEGVRTAQLANAHTGTEYGVVGSATWTNVTVMVQSQRQNQSTQVPLTTGKVTVMGTVFNTQQTQTGSHNLNTANLTGMISLVRPNLAQTFSRRFSDGLYTGPKGGFFNVSRVQMTFGGEYTPEPGTTALLAFGGLGLAVLGRRRRG